MTMILHAGGQLATREDIDGLTLPPATKTWHPTGHGQVIDAATSALTDAGYKIERQQFALARDGARFFGTLDLSIEVAAKVTLAVGLRNSFDKSFPMGFVAGTRVFVCDNLAFHSDLMVKRKHTRYGVRDFDKRIFDCVAKLNDFKAAEGRRVAVMQARELKYWEAESLVLRAAVDRGVLPLAKIVDVLKEWRTPSHEEFAEKANAWRLYNAFTSALGYLREKNPNELARRTMRLGAMMATDFQLAV